MNTKPAYDSHRTIERLIKSGYVASTNMMSSGVAAARDRYSSRIPRERGNTGKSLKKRKSPLNRYHIKIEKQNNEKYSDDGVFTPVINKNR